MTLRTKLSFVAFASFALFACSTSTNEDATDQSDSAFEESEALACGETYARKFYVGLAGRACADVPGYRGKWVAAPLEDGAPGRVCTMTWDGEWRSRADVDALRKLVTYPDVMTAACGSGPNVDHGYLTPIPRDHVHMYAGANGCDVCGELRDGDGSIVVVLPPDRTTEKQIDVGVSDGTTLAFQIHAADDARAVDVQLPALPAGLSYVASSLTVH
jgi:hypothetical protein